MVGGGENLGNGGLFVDRGIGYPKLTEIFKANLFSISNAIYSDV